MTKLFFNLQMFGEGGASGPSGSAGADGAAFEGTNDEGMSFSQALNDIRNTDSVDPAEEISRPQKSKSQVFDDLIKNEYKDEFTKKTQNMINKRFKESKQMEEQLRSHDPLINLLAEKYGVDGKDINALTAAIEDDESFYQREALEKGLSVEQLKELKRLQRENQAFRDAEAEAERRANSDRIYAQWQSEAEELASKYGLTDFSLEAEVQNPDFTRLLASGISVESAYKALHMDEMIGGAMAKTANTVKEQLVNSIATRASRPAENGINSSSSPNFKGFDVNATTKAERDRIDREVMRGRIIRL